MNLGQMMTSEILRRDLEQKNQSPVRNDKNERTMEDLYSHALKYIKDTKF